MEDSGALDLTEPTIKTKVNKRTLIGILNDFLDLLRSNKEMANSPIIGNILIK